MFKIFTDKDEARAVALEKRANVADRLVLSKIIADRVLPLVYGNVMVYAAIGSEVDTSTLISALNERSDVTVFVPYTEGCEIIPRRLRKIGVPNNIGNLPLECYADIGNASTKIDCCISPLIGFNCNGYRIGYGKGCYDRYFAQEKTRRIGLAYSVQYIDFLPEPHDIPLDCCVTEKDVIYFEHEGDLGKV